MRNFKGDELESRSRGAASTVGESESTDDHFNFPNVHQKDAFLVFRALCVLAAKDEGDPNDLKYITVLFIHIYFSETLILDRSFLHWICYYWCSRIRHLFFNMQARLFG